MTMTQSKRLGFLAALAFCVACAGNQGTELRPTQGTPAPAFSATDQGGAAISLAALQQHGPVVLTFLRSFS